MTEVKVLMFGIKPFYTNKDVKELFNGDYSCFTKGDKLCRPKYNVVFLRGEMINGIFFEKHPDFVFLAGESYPFGDPGMLGGINLVHTNGCKINGIVEISKDLFNNYFTII